MNDNQALLSQAFKTFLAETPEHAKAWMFAVQDLNAASALDKRLKA